MSISPAPRGPSQVPAWVMRFNEMVERLYLVLRVNIVWGLLSLMGLLVLGIAPASVAAADVFIASRHHAKVRVLPMMWTSFRGQLLAANIRMLPLMAVQVGAGAMLWLVAIGALPGTAPTIVLGSVAAISAAWSTASVAAIMSTPRLRRQDPLVTWRLALLVPGAIPLRMIGLIVGLLLWLLLCAVLWPVALLLGAATAIDLATSLLGRRIELLLEDIDDAAGTAT